MKKLLSIIILLVGMSVCARVCAQDYNPGQKYSFWSNWSVGFNVDFANGRAYGSQYKGGVGLDIQAVKKLSPCWDFRLTGGAPVIIKSDDVFDRYGLFSAGVMWTLWKDLYIAVDGGASTKVLDKWNPYFTTTSSVGYRFEIDNSNMINLEAGCNYIYRAYSYPNKADHFIRIGWTHCFGPTKTDRMVGIQIATRQQEYENARRECIRSKKECDSLVCINRVLGNICGTQSQIISAQRDTIERQRADLSNSGTDVDSVLVWIDDIANNVYSPTIIFQVNSTEISRDQEPYIDGLMDILADITDTLYIYGYADGMSGTSEYNMKISEARARAFKSALVVRGFDSDRIIAVGRGTDVDYGDNNCATSRKAVLNIPIDYE